MLSNSFVSYFAFVAIAIRTSTYLTVSLCYQCTEGRQYHWQISKPTQSTFDTTNNKYTYSLYRLSIIHKQVTCTFVDLRLWHIWPPSRQTYVYIFTWLKLYSRPYEMISFFHDNIRWTCAKYIFLPVVASVTAFVFPMVRSLFNLRELFLSRCYSPVSIRPSCLEIHFTLKVVLWLLLFKTQHSEYFYYD